MNHEERTEGRGFVRPPNVITVTCVSFRAPRRLMRIRCSRSRWRTTCYATVAEKVMLTYGEGRRDSESTKRNIIVTNETRN